MVYLDYAYYRIILRRKWIGQFEDIKNRIGVTDEVFIEHLAEWNPDLDKYINKNNIKDCLLYTSPECRRRTARHRQDNTIQQT